MLYRHSPNKHPEAFIFECPVCGSRECDEAYFKDGDCLGCDQCVDTVYVDDMEPDDETPYDEEHDDMV